MKDLGSQFEYAPDRETAARGSAGNRFAAQGGEMWYTSFALNTSVVLCGPSGAVLDLRLPASSFLRTFYA